MSIPMAPWGAFQPPPPGTQANFAMPTNTPAYIPVQVRQTFNFAQPQPNFPQPIYAQPQPHYTQFPQAPPPPHVQPEPAKKKKVDWPLSVRHYVQRAFDTSNMVPDVSRPEMEAKLKDTISSATENNTLYNTDWDSLPLPQQMIRHERAHATVPWRNSPVGSQPGSSGHQTPQRDTVPKKRKSQELSDDNDTESTSMPPWHNTNIHNGFEDRTPQPPPISTSRFSIADPLPAKATSKFQKNMEKRQRRFDGGYKSTYQPSPSPEPNSGPVVGRSQVLEKNYFRLTAPPNPDAVRPESVLKQTLELLKKKWRKEGNYSYICDQFKSLRQDLYVQHIKNKFTVEVYEIHARIALEKGDLGEYNQCQTQLPPLYAQNLAGNPMEFMAYRILYFIHTCNRTALNDVLADLTPAQKKDPAIKHALGVRSALALGNYHRFFRLYLETPNMGAYLMDMFVVRERLAALSNICKSYKPDVKLRFVTEELGFESDADAARFICDHNGRDLLQQQEGGDEINFFTAKAGNIFEAAKGEAFRKVDIKGQI